MMIARRPGARKSRGKDAGRRWRKRRDSALRVQSDRVRRTARRRAERKARGARYTKACVLRRLCHDRDVIERGNRRRHDHRGMAMHRAEGARLFMMGGRAIVLRLFRAIFSARSALRMADGEGAGRGRGHRQAAGAEARRGKLHIKPEDREPRRNLPNERPIAGRRALPRKLRSSDASKHAEKTPSTNHSSLLSSGKGDGTARLPQGLQKKYRVVTGVYFARHRTIVIREVRFRRALPSGRKEFSWPHRPSARQRLD